MIKVLWCSDNPQRATGQGIQTKKILSKLAQDERFESVSMGVYSTPGVGMQIFQGIRIYPMPDFTHAPTFRTVLTQERPDILVLFADPRYFVNTFALVDEFRPRTRVVFYHLWDNDPVPEFNSSYYECVDGVICGSQFTYNLLKQLSTPPPLYLAPHVFDPSDYYTLPPKQLEDAHKKWIAPLGIGNPDLILFWNNRAIVRKRPGDLIRAFSMFAEEFEQLGKQALLIIKTRQGMDDKKATDLASYRKVFKHGKIMLLLEDQGVSNMNELYNLADATVCISYNEGFGMSVGESLFAGTPVVATKTGGMTEQITCGDQAFGVALPPTFRSLSASPGLVNCPYIYEDFTDVLDIKRAFEQIYAWKQHGMLANIGQLGQEHALKHFSTEVGVESFKEAFFDILKGASKPSYKVVTL